MRVLSVSGAVRQRRTPDHAGHTSDDAEGNGGRSRVAEGETAAGARTGRGFDDKRRSDEGRGEDDASHRDRGRDDGRGYDGTIAIPDEAKGNGGAGAGARKGGGRDDKCRRDEGREEDVARHKNRGREYVRGDDEPSQLPTKQKGKEAQARGRVRRAEATTSAGAARDRGRKTHATRTTDEAMTTKRKGTETQARRRREADETAKPAEGEGE